MKIVAALIAAYYAIGIAVLIWDGRREFWRWIGDAAFTTAISIYLLTVWPLALLPVRGVNPAKEKE